MWKGPSVSQTKNDFRMIDQGIAPHIAIARLKWEGRKADASDSLIQPKMSVTKPGMKRFHCKYTMLMIVLYFCNFFFDVICTVD